MKHRQGLDNVVDIDTQARIVDFCAGKLDIPAIDLSDYAAAFSSVAHAFLFICLSMVELPSGFVNFLEALYSDNKVFVNIDGVIICLFNVYCGVLQGWPASGTLFVIAIDPCLRLIAGSLEPPEIVRAFADDIAIVIERLKTLRRIASIFEAMRLASNLAVKPKKCVIISLGKAFSDKLVEEVRRFLAVSIPDWAKFAVKHRVEYLGFFIGSDILKHVWSKAEVKWDKQAREIAAALLPLLECRYTTRVR